MTTMLPAIREVTREVIEVMFFSEAEPVACGHTDDYVAARVRFTGGASDPSNGELTVMLSPELACSLSAAFLAEEEDEVTPEQRSQVSCELANILCGAILSRLHPNSRVALGVPEPAAADYDGSTHQCFATPEGLLAVTIRTGNDE